MRYDYILALDPSGSFNEGKGTTGWCVYNCLDKQLIHSGIIEAKNFDRMEIYWDAHLKLIEKWASKWGGRLIVVMEDYLLYADKASSQVNSRMETCQLIGVLKYFCWTNSIDYTIQPASEVKIRWTNAILLYKKIIIQSNKKLYLPLKHKSKSDALCKHSLDAIRHAVHFATFKNER